MVLAISATLPTFTATALQNVQFLGYVCAVGLQLYDSFGNLGKVQLTDGAGGNFLEATNLGTALNITSTATGTNTSLSETSQASKSGIEAWLTITSIAATCTVRLNFLNSDPTGTGGADTLIWNVSLDGSSLGTGSPIGTFLARMTKGQTTPQQGTQGANLFISGQHPGTNIKVQVSITATASGGGANINYKVGWNIIN